jgi:hypothetical protein
MGKKDKLIARLKTHPKDFTMDEVVSLLGFLGFHLKNKGKTSGSRIEFINSETGMKIIMHKPHPDNVLKDYQIKQILIIMEREGLI